MFLKSLIVKQGDGKIIREINFHLGLNLIVDDTPTTSGKETGNNVGKTTVLKLIDFCLGADKKIIYVDTENKRVYQLVKDFLIEQEVIICLILKEDLLQEESKEILIERNFLSYKHKIQRINGENIVNDKDFEDALKSLLFPTHQLQKPTLRQIIAHNIRHKDISINNTLKNVDPYTKNIEYESLYLFLFGCDFEHGYTKQELRSQIEIEEKFKKRLESKQTKSAYETALSLIEIEIEELQLKKDSLNLNPNYESDLRKLNNIKYQINVVSSEIGKLNLRKELIKEAQQSIKNDTSRIDLTQLKQIYQQATSLVAGIQRSFEDLHAFHNKMIESKVRFIIKDLPIIETKLNAKQKELRQLLHQEEELNQVIIQSDTFEALETLIVELNNKFQQKGEFENTLSQLKEVDEKLVELKGYLNKIDEDLYSDEFETKLQIQINKFNVHFNSISQTLYGEKYALKVDPKIDKKGRRIYEFTAFNLNFGSGKKQGEISCFDIAYTLFAGEENIPCLHFLLNDKKELMHGNQLMKISDLVKEKGIQFVASILKDKLPPELDKDEYIIVKLSQNEKLFRIE